MPKGLQGFQKGNKLGLGNKNCLGRTFKHSDATKEKMREARKNRKGYIHILTPKRLAHLETLKGTSYWLGKKFSEEHKNILKIKAKKGATNNKWKGGITIGKNLKVYKQVMENKRRSLKMGSKKTHNVSEWLELKKKYNYMCLCCKKTEPEIKLTEDHIIPLSKGGDNSIENIQPLCSSCNSRKFTKTINYIELFYATTNI